MIERILSILFKLAIAALGLSLVACTEPKSVQEPIRPVRVTTINFENAVNTSNYSGEVKVRHELSLSFQVPGKIAKRLVDVGAKVKPGQLLATLDPPDYLDNQASAVAQLNAAQAELSQARKDLLHANNLYEKELTSLASVERRQDALRAAQARAEQAQAALALSARKTAYAKLIAENAGVIAGVEAEIGQYVGAGQTIFRLAKTDEKEVVINVPENHLDELKTASEIKVSLWASPGLFYGAKLREISPGVDATIRTFTVKVSILEPGDEVHMGMTATVYVRRRESHSAALVPLTAVSQQGQQTVVWLYDASTQTVRPQAVTLDGYDDVNAKILDGVKTGDRVVTAGVHKLLAGEKVRLLEGGKP